MASATHKLVIELLWYFDMQILHISLHAFVIRLVGRIRASQK